MNKASRRLLCTVVTLALIPTLGACSKARGITAQSLCVGFMDLSQSERDDVVNRLAVELNNPEVTTPLIRPNVEYMCAQEPTRRLGSVIEMSRLTPQPESPSEAPTAPSEEGVPAAEPDIQETFEDSDGYSYTWGARNVAYDVTSDVANAKPGQTIVTVVITADMFVENTTSGRNAAFPQDLMLFAAWESGSPACGLDMADDQGDYCFVEERMNFDLTRGPIAADTSKEFPWKRTAKVSVPEADSEGTIEELQNPAFIGLGRPGGKYDSLIETGVWVSAISDPSRIQKR